MKVDGIEIQTNLEDLDEDEASKYIRYVEEHKKFDELLEEIERVKHSTDNYQDGFNSSGRVNKYEE